jgi:hypothetical protein
MAKDSRTLKLEVLAETKQFVKGMNDANKETESFGDKIGDFGKKAALALAAVGVAAGAMAIKIGKEAVKAASDLAESTSKVGVIFGNVSTEIEKFAAQAAESLGQTRIQAQNAASTFATFGKAAGLTGKDLSNFSIEFVRLASDLASFNNTTVDQAVNALGAALRGEAEPIRAYGVLLNDATLKAKAMEMGIYSGTGVLDAQSKVLAAHQVVLEQTGDAQGDFARTADGMANSQKILTARLEEAKITLGEALLPIALAAVNLFTDRFLPVIEKLASAFSNGSGDGLIDKIKTLVKEIGTFLEPVINAVKQTFENFTKAIANNKDNINDVVNAVIVLFNFFNTYFVPLLKGALINAIEGVGIAFQVIGAIAGPIFGAIGNMVSGIVGILDKAIRGIQSLINIAIAGINAAITAYNSIPILPDIKTIPGIKTGGLIGGNTVDPKNLPFGGGSVSGSTSGSSSAAAAAAAAAAGLGGLLSGSMSGGSLGGLTASGSSRGSTTLTQTLIEEISEANWLKKTIESGVFDAASFRRGEEADRGIVINVNAPSAIDEEGFTRAVVVALNNSNSRTGAGALQLTGL